MNRLVLPAFRGYALREIGVARCDALLKELGKQSYARSKRPKTVLRLAFGLAVRHEVIHRNPIDGVARLHKPKRTPTALTATEVNAIRAVIKTWELSRGTTGPNPDGQLGQIVEIMLGTSARIGEVLAIRRRDLDLTMTPATLRICGTVISERGVGTYRQGASEDRPLQPGDRAAVLHGRGLNLASELLGHTDPKATIEHYIRRNEQVNPLTAELLDQAFAREEGGAT